MDILCNIQKQKLVTHVHTLSVTQKSPLKRILMYIDMYVVSKGVLNHK